MNKTDIPAGSRQEAMMNTIRLLIALGLGALVSACGSGAPVTRAAPFDPLLPRADGPFEWEPVQITQIHVTVPRSLQVSEANGYLPSGDIVWRGDAMGDRHAQVEAIFDAAFARTASSMTGPRAVIVEARVTRFHAITERARYSTGGVHNIEFDLLMRDASTGAPLAAPRQVRADLVALGGTSAIEADARGETQKVRITAHLAEVLRQEIMMPAGHRTARLGLIQQLNNPF